ncbi:hypothetical protein XHV734_0167 [Xanthomonas hortorum pv. vitians]|nr:hypothetical protein XHV734_0167 [Xanthomonas hortorum pv. vitians]
MSPVARSSVLRISLRLLCRTSSFGFGSILRHCTA